MMRFRGALIGGVMGLLAGGTPAHAQSSAPPLLRVFLRSGASLTSFGEWVKVNDRITFSLPLGDGAAPELQLVSVSGARVDWPRTERYAATARSLHYASTRAEDDYAQFSNQVAEVLTGVAREPDPKRRLATAVSARAAMAAWPSQHHGYRAADVELMLGMLDEVISDLRAAAGEDSFELGLVATTADAVETLLPPPSPAQLAEELLTASTLAESPAERVMLLERLVGLLDRTAAKLPAGWAARARSTAVATIAAERTTDAAYAKLAATTLKSAALMSRAADVRGLERLKAGVMKADATRGAKRPAEVSALLSALDESAAEARRLRLARDQWRLLEPNYRSYRRAMAPVLSAMTRAEQPLEDIRSQAGPSPQVLAALAKRFYRARPAVAGTNPPPTLAAAHALLQSAWDLADNAFKLRLRAIESGDQPRATEASAAAAGALMLMARAREDLDRALLPPSLP